VADPERVLIRLPNWLGDVLLSRPLIQAVRRALPAADITAVAPASLLELLGAESAIDHFEPWPEEARARKSLIARLRRTALAAALVLPPSFSSAWFTWRTRARVRAGFSHEGRDPLLTHALPHPARGEMHLSDEYLVLGRVIGARSGTVPDLALPSRAFEQADSLCRHSRIASSGFVVLGPGARYGPAKRWGSARFAALGRHLASGGQRVLVCGGGDERAICAEVAGEIGAGATSLAGKTDLLTQAALCARASLTVCNDSGLAHLSGGLGTPTVVIFGSTSSAWTAPLGPRVRVVQHAPVCSPCFQRRCRIGYRCLAAVQVGTVARACAELAA
jgi:heptosyltransferase-2